eukprot:COSAG01_NODE_1066_length_11878_cov_244.494949_8_plen_55_part_00
MGGKIKEEVVEVQLIRRMYCTFAFSVQQKFSLLSLQGFGKQDQIRSAASDPVEF